jgi:hypothetical protein
MSRMVVSQGRGSFRFPASASNAFFPMQPLRQGGGGFISGIDIIVSDGTRVTRTDTFGAYVWDAAAAKHQQLCTTMRLAAGQQIPLSACGVYEARIAPSNSNVIYMFYGEAEASSLKPWLLVSNDKGGSFVEMSNWTAALKKGAYNGNLRGYGYKAAVDPINADDFLFTMEDGNTYETLNGTSGASATFVQKTTVPTGTVDTIGCVAFDPGSGSTGGRTNAAYVSSWGQGLYLRTTPTGNFSLVTGTASMQIMRLKVHIDGTVYFLTGITSGPTVQAIKRLSWSAGVGSTPTITDISTANLPSDILLDPASANNISAWTFGSGIYQSTDKGDHWTQITSITLDATSAPYLKTGDVGGSANVGGGRFSPVVTDGTNIYVSGWQAPYKTTYPIQTGGTQAFTLDCAGIEQMATNAIILPAGSSKAILCQQDWGLMISEGPNSPPLAQGWKNSGSTNGLSSVWHADWASDGSGVVVAVSTSPDLGSDTGAKSTLNGQGAWSAWANFPAAGADPYGAIAVADALNWVRMGTADCYYTLDGAATAWTKIVNPGGVTIASSDGWVPGAFYRRRVVASDRVNIGTFYLWNSNHGLFRSTDKGVTWTNYNNYAGSTNPAVMDPSQANGKLVAVPGQAGHLFFHSYGGSGGSYAGPNTASRVWQSTDGGQTWSIVGPSSTTAAGAIVEAWGIDLGAIAPGQSYPSIYLHCWVYSGSAYVQQLIRSIDGATTWARLAGAYPDGWCDATSDIAADKLIYGRVYQAKFGSSFSVGQYA